MKETTKKALTTTAVLGGLFLLVAIPLPARTNRNKSTNEEKQVEKHQPIHTPNSSKTETKVDELHTYLEAYGAKKEREVRKLVKKVYKVDLKEMSNYRKGISPYSQDILELVRTSLNVDSHSTTKDQQIMAMPKLKIMDICLKAKKEKLDAELILNLLNEIYGLDVEALSISEQGRLSLWSNGQWVVKGESDLFEVYLGESGEDTKLKVFPTLYFSEKTGLQTLPNELEEALLKAGLTKETDGVFRYNHCASRPNSLQIVHDIIQHSYTIL